MYEINLIDELMSTRRGYFLSVILISLSIFFFILGNIGAATFFIIIGCAFIIFSLSGAFDYDKKAEKETQEQIRIREALAKSRKVKEARINFRQQQNPRHITKTVQREVWRRDGGKCVECGSQLRLEYDHIIPFSKGGSNTTRNIQLLCEKCNRKKSGNI